MRLGRCIHGISNSALAGLVIFAVLVMPSMSDAQSVGNKDFEWALERAKSASGSLNNSLIKPKDGKRIPLVKAIQGAGQGNWKVSINGAWLTSSSTFQTVTYTGVVMNTGKEFKFAFLGQPVENHLVKEIRNHKGMVKAENAWIKKHEDMDVIVGIDGNRISLQGHYIYSAKTDRGDIADRLELLFSASNGVLQWTEYAGRDVEKDYAKQQQKEMKQALTFVNKTDFQSIVGEDLSEVEDAHENGEQGYWIFAIKGRDYEIFNHGNATDLTYYRTIPESIAGGARDEVFQEIAKFVKKNKVDHAEGQETVWFDEDIIWIKVHFPFNGKLTAGDFKEGYWNFFNEFSPKLHKEIDQILSKY